MHGKKLRSKKHDRLRTSSGLFVTDLDGTLLTDAKTIRQEEFDSLRALRSKNVSVALATGRSAYSLQRLLAGDNALNGNFKSAVDYVIFSTGAGIMDAATGSILVAHALSVENVLEISQRLEALEIEYMVHAPIPHTHRMYYRPLNGGGPDFQRRISMYSEFAVKLPALDQETCDSFGGATEVLGIVDKVRGHQLALTLADTFNRFSVIKATSPLDHESIWIEIFHKNGSKSAAVQWLAKKLGIPRECVCSVGNDYNDEDMLCWSGSAFLVGNAPKALKAVHTVVASNNAGGVTEAALLWLNRLRFISGM